MNINLHIERLVLDGFDITSDQRHLLRDRVTTEFAQMLTGRGLSPSLTEGTALPRLSTGNIQLASNKPMELGQQIAQSVYGGIGHE